jgi:tRNA pseudouridine13 synthase
MEFYASAAPGVPARLKSSPEAFAVTEISSYPLPDPDGAFTVLRVRSRDWEQHELAAALGRALHLPPHAVRWAGTKDRRAVAERLLSYRGPLPPPELALPRVEILEAYRARDGLVLGHHYGNAFSIRLDAPLRPPAEAAIAYAQVREQLHAFGGFPNFFGPQRFGEVRPVTAEVGRCLVRGDTAAAVETYLTAPPPSGEPGPGDAARARYRDHHDPARALREFPPEYRFERALLDRLARGRSPERALHGLARELRLLFVHAYQSLLFNRWLSRRHAIGLSLVRPVEGDRLLRLERDGTVRAPDAVPVGPDNRPECEELVARGRALVAGPLVGYDTPIDSGAPGELLRQVLDEDGADRAGFRLPAAPEIASRGAWRPLVVPMPPFTIAPLAEAVEFRFALPRGSYATVLLREFLKDGAAG